MMMMMLPLFLAAAVLLFATSSNAFTVVSPPSSLLTTRQPATRPKHGVVLFMGWGPDPIWTPTKVVSVEEACESGACMTVHLQVSKETAADYNVPGQYVQVRVANAGEDDKPLFLAIASAPDAEAETFEFLVKKTDNNDWMTGASAGTAMEISQVLGGGFPLEENLEGFKYDFPTQQVLLFAAGSGIAPIKAAMESGSLNVEDGGRSARLYYGERTPADLCFTEDFPKWEQAGIQVVPVLSQPPSEDEWQGRTGYVQTALEEDGISIPRNSGALLCGMKGMTQAVQDLLTQAGVFEGRILFNF